MVTTGGACRAPRPRLSASCRIPRSPVGSPPLVQGLEHLIDHIRPMVCGAKPGDGEEVRGLILPLFTCQPMKSSPPGEAS